MIELLIDNGADVLLADKYGEYAVDNTRLPWIKRKLYNKMRMQALK